MPSAGRSASPRNTLATIALKGKPGEKLGALLKGMTVFAYSEDPVAAAKVSEAYAKKNDKFVFLAGRWATRFWTRPG